MVWSFTFLLQWIGLLAIGNSDWLPTSHIEYYDVNSKKICNARIQTQFPPQSAFDSTILCAAIYYSEYSIPKCTNLYFPFEMAK